MLVPNAENAVVDIRKLEDYCLTENHPLGKHKARLFASALGIRKENANDLKDLLLSAIKTVNASLGVLDDFGQRYIVDFEAKIGKRKAIIRSAWIIEKNFDVPKLITCFII